MSLIIKKNTTFKIPRTGLFLPSSLGGLALWLKADTGITLQTYISQVVLTCTGGLSSFSGTYIANGFPDADNNYSLSCPANGKSITCEEGRFYLDQNSNVDSYDCINWNLNNQITVGIMMTGNDIPDELSGGYGLNERSETFADLINDTGGNIQGSIGNWSLYDTATFTLQYSNSSTYGDGQWTNEAAGGEAFGSSVILDPDGTISGTVTRSINYGYQTVIEWADQSENGNNAIPVADNPIYNVSDLNSKPTISLTSMSDNVERVFSISINPLGVAGSTAFSVQYVEDVCNYGNDNGPIFGNFGGSEDSNAFSQTHYPYGPDCFVYDAFATRLRKDGITPPVTITNAWTLYSVKSTDNDWQSFVNGQLMYSDPTNTYSSAVGGDDTTLYIGKQTANGTYSLKGKVAEVIVYNRVLTTPERQQVEAYLNSKYEIY